MRSAPKLGAALLVAMGACELNFTEPLRESTPRLSLWVSSTDSAAGSLRIIGSLSPGFTERGVPREVQNEALTVGGEALFPMEVHEDGARRYQKQWTTSPFSTSPILVIRAPRVAGVQSIPPTLELRIPRRLGPELLHVARGDPIEFRLAGTESPPPGVLHAYWRLTVSDPNRRMSDLQVHADGFPPGTVSVPAEWLPAGAGPDLSARLVIGFTTESGTTSSYMTRLSVNAALFWSIRRSG